MRRPGPRILAAALDRLVTRADTARWSHRERRLRAQLGRVGAELDVRAPWHISHPADVVLGDDVYIGRDANFSTSGGLRIGNSCRFGPKVVVYTWNHDIEDTSRLPYGPARRNQPVTIGDYVWVGACTTIVPGVTIGDGAVVAMGSVVTTDVEPLTIVGGNPARPIGRRDADAFEAARLAMER